MNTNSIVFQSHQYISAKRIRVESFYNEIVKKGKLGSTENNTETSFHILFHASLASWNSQYSLLSLINVQVIYSHWP